MLSQDDAHRMAHSWWAKKRYRSINLFYFWSRDFPNKEQIWEDLIFLTKDKKSYIKQDVKDVFSFIFKEIADKEKGWQDLHELTMHEDFEVRCTAIYTIGNVFEQIPDKKTAWEDIHRLITDEHIDVQLFEITALVQLSSIFPIKNMHGRTYID